MDRRARARAGICEGAAIARLSQGRAVIKWIILVSCLVKVVLQLEFGKHTIASGEPTMVAFNKLPGP